MRDAFYAIDSYAGLIKTYQEAVQPRKPGCAGGKDYLFTHFVEGEILPLTQ